MSTLAFIKKKISYDEVSHELDAVVDIVAKETNPYAIFLFGSLARNEFSNQSDIDFLIVTNSVSEISAGRKALAKIRPFTKFPVDIIWMSREDFKRKSAIGGIAQIVKEEGILLFGSLP